MEKGSIMLDREATSLPQLVGEYAVSGSSYCSGMTLHADACLGKQG